MGKVWRTDLPPTTKLVLLAVADHASRDGTNAWPSLATLSEMSGVSVRQVRRILRDLEERGMLEVEDQRGGTTDTRPDRRPNRYTVVLDGRTSMSARAAEREDIGVTNGRTPMSAEPSLEPTTTPSLRSGAAAIAEPLTVNQRANRIATTYSDVQPLCNFPAVAGIAKKALNAGHPDTEVENALLRLAHEGRSVTVESLRVELEGLPPATRRRPPTVGERAYAELQRRRGGDDGRPDSTRGAARGSLPASRG